MPARDKTGPQGSGSMTGHRMGVCVDNDNQQSKVFGRGGGGWRSRGFWQKFGFRQKSSECSYSSQKDPGSTFGVDISLLKDKIDSLEKKIDSLKKQD